MVQKNYFLHFLAQICSRILPKIRIVGLLEFIEMGGKCSKLLTSKVGKVQHLIVKQIYNQFKNSQISESV